MLAQVDVIVEAVYMILDPRASSEKGEGAGRVPSGPGEADRRPSAAQSLSVLRRAYVARINSSRATAPSGFRWGS